MTEPEKVETSPWKAKLLDLCKQLDPEGNVLKKFDHNSGKIELTDSIRQHQKQKFEDEAYVRIYLVLRLIMRLRYPAQALELEKKYSIGHPSGKKARLDILVRDLRNKKEKPFMLLEAKTPNEFEKYKELSIKHQLFAIAQQEIIGAIRPRYLVYYTIRIEENEIKDNAIIIDFRQSPSYEDWKSNGEPALDEIPLEYGVAKKYTFANIDKPDTKKGWRPLRKDYALSDFERLRVDLHNKLWAGGEADYNDIFYHLVKIMLVKIYDEMFVPAGKTYEFQIFYKDGRPESADELASRLNATYKTALRELLNYDDEKIREIPLIEKDKFTFEKLFYAVEQIQEISLVENVHGKEEDVLGLFFESILQNEFKQSKGQYFTHKNVVRFLIHALELDCLAVQKLNQHQPHFPYIIDAAAGSGTFLIETMKAVTKAVVQSKSMLELTRALKDKIQDLENPDRRNKWAEDYVYGIEPNAKLGLATKLNMILHGDGNMNIFIEDGLMPFKVNGDPFYTRKWKGKDQGVLAESYKSSVYPKPVNGQFDVVMSNPPFSMEIQAMRSYRYVEDTFLYSRKTNSENLFIERWFQLLKPKGRLGVVLPESVLDTTENLYIRNFLYRFFKMKAIVSLPHETFAPYTTTKVSLVIAEKKSDEEVKEWEDSWREHANNYNKLRRARIIEFFFDNNRLLEALRNLLSKYHVKFDYSKVFVADLYGEKVKANLQATVSPRDSTRLSLLSKEIDDFCAKHRFEDLETESNKNIVKQFLKGLYPNDKEFPSFRELLEYVYDDVLEVANLDYPDVSGRDNYCNSWWVFGEVSKQFDFPIFFAHVDNVGYKRSKRGELDKDIPVRDERGEIVAFKNDLFRQKAQKIKRQYWLRRHNKEILEEKEEIIKTDVYVDSEDPETVLDRIRKAKIWSDKPDFAFLLGANNEK
jgi:type I restriction enzyme M protein